MKAKMLILVASCLIIMSCDNGKKDTRNNVYEKKILKVSSRNKFNSNDYNFKRKYINLSFSSDSIFLSSIDKIKFHGNYIYILDATGQNLLYQFDTSGRFIRTIGRRGKGPSEYIRIRDFDIDKAGNIFLYDMQVMKIIKFDRNNNWIADMKLPFRADAFNLLNNGFIFSLLKNRSKSLTDNAKIVVTDSTFKIVRTFFQYENKYQDDKYSHNIFREIENGILYNKPVNNTFYIFNMNGMISEAFTFDYGNKQVPIELTFSYNKLVEMRSKRNYYYMYDSPIKLKNQIIGNMFCGDSKCFYLYDLNTNKFYLNEITQNNFYASKINFPIGVIGDSTVISYLDIEIYNAMKDPQILSNDISEHLKKENFTLCLHTIDKKY